MERRCRLIILLYVLNTVQAKPFCHKYFLSDNGTPEINNLKILLVIKNYWYEPYQNYLLLITLLSGHHVLHLDILAMFDQTTFRRWTKRNQMLVVTFATFWKGVEESEELIVSVNSLMMRGKKQPC